jgi:preprotein translocase subunit YajC
MFDFLIPAAMAADAGGAGSGSPIAGLDIFIIVAFALVFYFIVWRPQSKRAKEHRELVGALAKGDEIVTTGGVLGKIVRVEEQYIAVEVAPNVELKIQKHAVAAALPKGTIKQI